MPYTKDGKRVDIMLNLLAVINRTTAASIAELLITAICWDARKHMATLQTLEEKADVFFSLLNDFNKNQYKKEHDRYVKMDDDDKKRYIASVIETGIFLHEKPMYSEEYLFYRLLRIMKKYKWIASDDIYINKWGRRIRCMQKSFIGNMYMIKLKQSDRRGYSSRNTGAIDILGLPTRRYKSRSHLEQTSSTAIRFGEYETLNFSIGLVPEDIAAFHALYRTSIKGRRDFLQSILTNKPLATTLDDYYISRVAETLNVRAKSLGFGFEFNDSDEMLRPIDDTIIRWQEFEGKKILCTNYQLFVLQQEKIVRQEVEDIYPVATTSFIQQEVKQRLKDKFLITDIKYNENGELLYDQITRD